MKAVALLSLAAGAFATKGEQISKVIEMLQGMQATLKAEGEEDKRIREESQADCVKNEDSLGDMIRENVDKKAAAEANIEKFAGEIVEHDTEVEKLGAEIAQNTGDLAEARKIRAQEKADFESTEKELSEAIDALVRASSILRRGGAKHTPGAFAQIAQGLGAVVDASFINEDDRAQLKAFMQASTEEEDGPGGAPEGAAYSNHSTNILDLLNSMKNKAEGELQEAKKAEMNAQHNFNMMESSLTNQVKDAQENMAENKQLSGQKGQSKGENEGALAAADKALAEDRAAQAQNAQSCERQAADFAQRESDRAEEAAAVGQAVEILSNQAGSFMQVKDDDSEDVREQVSALLQATSNKYHSVAFSQLASRMRVGDAFGKVKGLIEDMIAKLQKQAAEEADKKAYCDTEKKKGDAEQNKLEARSNVLSTRRDAGQASAAQAKADITQLASEIAELNSNRQDATTLRQDQAAAFAKFKADSEKEISALSNANQVLAEYFDKGTGASSSTDNQSTGVRALLETAQAEVEKSLSEGTQQENQAKADHKDFMNESEVQLASKNAAKTGRESDLKAIMVGLEDTKENHQSTSAELNAVIEGLAKLRESCVHTPMSFEERAAKRADEIASLNQALELLTPDSSFLQRKITLHQ